MEELQYKVKNKIKPLILSVVSNFPGQRKIIGAQIRRKSSSPELLYIEILVDWYKLNQQIKSPNTPIKYMKYIYQKQVMNLYSSTLLPHHNIHHSLTSS